MGKHYGGGDYGIEWRIVAAILIVLVAAFATFAGDFVRGAPLVAEAVRALLGAF